MEPMEIRPYLRKVQFYETDGMGIVHHANYIYWMEEARTDLMDQLGWGYDRAVEAGIDFALTEVNCKYRSMTPFGETVAIAVTVTRLTTTSPAPPTAPSGRRERADTFSMTGRKKPRWP